MKDIKIDKKLLKIIIPVAIVLVIGLIAVIGGKAMKPTPEKAVQKYCEYLADKKYDKAYKMLYNTDNDFMSEEMFEASLQNVDFTGYAIKEVEDKDLFDYLGGGKSDAKKDEDQKSAKFQVQVQGKTYDIELLQNSKRDFIFKDYKIDATKLATKWNFKVPQGTEVYINNKKVGKIEGTIDKSSYGEHEYDPKDISVSIDSIFKGNCDVTLKLDGADDIEKSNVAVGETIPAEFKIKDDISKQLEKQAKEFLTTYYNKGDLSKLVTSDGKLMERYNKWKSTNVPAKINNEISTKQAVIVDSTHATVETSMSINTTYSVTNDIHGPLSDEDRTPTIKFKKENDKWLVCSFDEY